MNNLYLILKKVMGQGNDISKFNSIYMRMLFIRNNYIFKFRGADESKPELDK